MRVGILTQYYPPEIGAPQVRLSSLARRLHARGHEVVVLTAMPNYPTGKVHEGYGGIASEEVIDGVRVLRAFIYPTKSASMLARLTNYFSFVLSSILVGLVKLPRVDYLVVESPPLFLGIAGFLLSRSKRARLIFNVSDLWPDSASMLGVTSSNVLLGTARVLERFCYRTAWLVSGQTHGIVAAVSDRMPSTPTHFFPNGVDLDRFSPIADQLRTDEVCRFVYAGLHGLAQGLDQILDAAAQLSPRSDVRFDFVGDGPEKEALQERARALGLDNVRFHDPVPHDQVPALLAAADVAIVPLRYVITEAVPSKFYEAMAAGTAVLLISEGEAVRLLDEARAGVSSSPGDVSGIADAIRRFAEGREERDQMRIRARAFAEERFDRTKINDRFIAVLESEQR